MDDKFICKNCRYFQDVSSFGYCLFNAPFAIKEQRRKINPDGFRDELIEEVFRKEWVHVNETDWCGQFFQRQDVS